ncbi:hypothetical protein LT493_27015 [Streptomyces tricolor]|nr:hypothetical protein [Streptomyces tricolor]
MLGAVTRWWWRAGVPPLPAHASRSRRERFLVPSAIVLERWGPAGRCSPVLAGAAIVLPFAHPLPCCDAVPAGRR